MFVKEMFYQGHGDRYGSKEKDPIKVVNMYTYKPDYLFCAKFYIVITPILLKIEPFF